MFGPDRRHVDDFTLDELYPVVFGKDAGFAHAVKFLNGDPVTAWKGFGIDIHDNPSKSADNLRSATPKQKRTLTVSRDCTSVPRSLPLYTRLNGYEAASKIKHVLNGLRRQHPFTPMEQRLGIGSAHASPIGLVQGAKALLELP
jgi:hypothetical protein